MNGRVYISIKYDLGGKILDSDSFLEEIRKTYKAQNQVSDLRIFNLSYLSTKPNSIHLGTLEKNNWKRTTIVDQVGTVSFLLESPKVISDSKVDFNKKLLALYNLFVERKNIDYVRHLNDHDEIQNSLKNLKMDENTEEDEIFSFRREIRKILQIAQPCLDTRTRYNFHDFRTIFSIQALDEFRTEIQSLLNLEMSRNKDLIHDYASVIDFKGDTIFANTWSFVVDDDMHVNNDEFFTIFSLAHTNWFLAQSWVFNLRKLLHSKESFMLSSEEIHNLKSSIMDDLYIIKNADLVLKSSAYNALLSGFLDNFKISSQFELIELQIRNIENYIEKLNESFKQISQMQNQKNAAILEFLFAINAIAGIAAFAPTFFDNGLVGEVEINLPRLLSIFLLLFSSVIYFVFVYRRVKRRKNEIKN